MRFPSCGCLIVTFCGILSACVAPQNVSDYCADPVLAASSSHLVSEDELYATLALAPQTNAGRGDLLAQHMRDVGCGNLERPYLKRSKHRNVACWLPGTEDGIVVVGAHFDKLKGSRGIADNWSGVSLLPLLYRDLAAQSRRYSFWFVGFAEEERRLLGSKDFIRSVPEDKRNNIKAMINIDALGLGPMLIDPRSSDELELAVGCAARQRGLSIASNHFMPEMSGDWEPFRAVGIPVINFHSLNRRNLKIIHTSRDKLAAIRKTDYYNSYLLIRQLLFNLANSGATD